MSLILAPAGQGPSKGSQGPSLCKPSPKALSFYYIQGKWHYLHTAGSTEAPPPIHNYNPQTTMMVASPTVNPWQDKWGAQFLQPKNKV